jgi:hypothetical protein
MKFDRALLKLEGVGPFEDTEVELKRHIVRKDTKPLSHHGDVARRCDGTWNIVERGDGQVAGLMLRHG